VAGENIFVARIDPSSGTVVWVQQMGNYGSRAKSLACDGSANIYMTGYFGGNGIFGPHTLSSPGNNNAFLVKIHDVTAALDEKTVDVSLHIGPNPFISEFNLFFDSNVLAGYHIKISDALGKSIFETVSKQPTLTIRLPELIAGMYYLAISGQNGERVVRKIIKE
jgi:hypothetical protein